MRADEIVKETLKNNRASYDFLNEVGSNFYYEAPEAELKKSEYPFVVCWKAQSTGTPYALGTGSQLNRAVVQIDLYALKNVFVEVNSLKYRGQHFLKKLATDALNCLREHIYENEGIYRYEEIRAVPIPPEDSSDYITTYAIQIMLTLKDAE